MNKLFRKIAIIMLLAPSTSTLTSCDNQDEVLDEKLDYGFILERIKNHLENTGINARTLSSNDTKRQAFDFVSKYIKQQQNLIDIKNLEEQPDANLEVDQNGQVVIKIEVSLGQQNFLIDAKLLKVKTPLTILIEEMKKKHFKEGIILDGSDLDNQQTINDALAIIKKDPALSSKDYNFILEISNENKTTTLNEGQNKILVNFKLANKNYVETEEITVNNVKISPIKAAFKKLSVISNDQNLTKYHKVERFQDFIQNKLTEINKDLKIKSVLKQTTTNSDVSLSVTLEDKKNRTLENKIKITDLSIFKVKALSDEVNKIITDNNLVFEIPMNNDSDDDENQSIATIIEKYRYNHTTAADNKNLENLTANIKENKIIQKHCSYDVDWILNFINGSPLNAKTETNEPRLISVRIRIVGTSSVSGKVNIKYIVKKSD